MPLAPAAQRVGVNIVTSGGNRAWLCSKRSHENTRKWADKHLPGTWHVSALSACQVDPEYRHYYAKRIG